MVNTEIAPWSLESDECLNEGVDIHPFSVYRDLGPGRTLAEVSRLTGVPLPALQSQAGHRAWRARVAAWDRHCDEIRIKTVEDDVVIRAKRSRDAINLLGESIILELQKLLDSAKNPAFSALRPQILIRAVDSLVRLQRLVDGLPTENLAVAHVSYERLSDDELEQLRLIAEKCT